MNKKIIITTTNTIENCSIQKYLGIINTNIVIGTNIFSDIGASIVDIFGGNSTSYQNKLEQMQEQATEKLKLKLREIGGNAILGMSFDFDEISGGGKSMFMLSVSGTAVVYDCLETNITKTNDSISFKKVLTEMDINNVEEVLKKGKLISQEQWESIIENPNEFIANLVIDSFIQNYNSIGSNTDEGKTLLLNTLRFFTSIEESISKDVLYSKLSANTILTKQIIDKNKLFEASQIIKLLEKGQINTSLDLLSFDKPNYTHIDLKLMNDIITLLEQKELNTEQNNLFINFKNKVQVIKRLLEL